jgi:hypothetical protein
VWLPLQLVLEFLGRAVAWLGVMAALGVLAALLATVAFRRPLRSAWPGPVAGAVLGALLGASLSDRFGLPEPFTFQVWCRAVSLAWSAGGALLGALATILWKRWRRPPPSPTTDLPEDDHG